MSSRDSVQLLVPIVQLIAYIDNLRLVAETYEFRSQIRFPRQVTRLRRSDLGKIPAKNVSRHLGGKILPGFNHCLTFRFRALTDCPPCRGKIAPFDPLQTKLDVRLGRTESGLYRTQRAGRRSITTEASTPNPLPDHRTPPGWRVDRVGPRARRARGRV